MSPVYGLASLSDLLIFNSIEFWTGTNPISGKSPALVDTPVNSLVKMNQHLNAPLKKRPGMAFIDHVQLEFFTQDTAQMNLWYKDGTQAKLFG